MTALAIAMTTLSTAVASADTSSSASVECRLAADVATMSIDGRVHGIGAVTCTRWVHRINVAVTLSQDNRVVAGDRMTCEEQASCRADAAAPNRPGTQQWCAQSKGNYALSPTGPIIDLGSATACKKG